jgi:hypothetical protein
MKRLDQMLRRHQQDKLRTWALVAAAACAALLALLL